MCMMCIIAHDMMCSEDETPALAEASLRLDNPPNFSQTAWVPSSMLPILGKTCLMVMPQRPDTILVADEHLPFPCDWRL